MAGFGGRACPTGTRIFISPAGTGNVTGTHAWGTGAFRAGGAIMAGTGAANAMGVPVGRGAAKAEAKAGPTHPGCHPR